ncbi:MULTISPECIES: peptidoglycan-binding domain-containing protein [Pseudanabaena]|uniref:peptidoglycan-binding domain-containing protein n=1 Tax=Pseudanabaena TaxID=1152 RepID=UPI002478A2BA|nr:MULTISPECIES: peptidoglycan-binding domain-containing protein [Pseudanabaena]MEA5486159.1 peptidoglycan-binding domain-containing protein [Pseudanabaena sp. CCNP1317]WGS74385.1 peptidoglycan-binding domain-containing protein [Pseudanabaena galeata CCNP1313]
MELAAYIYDAWAYEQANQGTTDQHLITCDELCADKEQVNKFDWNFIAIKQQASLLSAIAFSFSGLLWNLAPAMATHVLEPSVNVAPWCNNLYLCNTSYMLEVQTLLAQRGFAVGAIDGVYGRYTKQAVIDFQRTQPNLVADGIPGEQTLALLRNSSVSKPLAPQPQNQPIGNPTSSDRVSQTQNQTIVIVRSNNPPASNFQQPAISEIGNLQMLLKRRGFYQGEIDGQLGQTTTNAILRAQKAYALAQDGFVGPLTIRALLAGGNNLPLTQPAFPRLPTTEDVLAIQTLLKERGFYDADLNGLYDMQTKAGILKAQLAYGQVATGDLSTDVLTALKSQNPAQTIAQITSSNANPTVQPILSPSSNPLGNGTQVPTSSQNAPAAKNANSS